MTCHYFPEWRELDARQLSPPNGLRETARGSGRCKVADVALHRFLGSLYHNCNIAPTPEPAQSIEIKLRIKVSLNCNINIDAGYEYFCHFGISLRGNIVIARLTFDWLDASRIAGTNFPKDHDMAGKVMAGTMILAAMVAGSAQAATKVQQPRPEIFDSLLKCRSVTDDKARLACFDRQSSEMESAAARDEVVVLDKSELKKTRKTLFGFAFPKLPFLGGANDDDRHEEEGFSHIATKIMSLQKLPYGKWQIGVEDGAQWVTTEAVTGRDPKVGQSIEIRRAAMGSFLGKVDGGRAVRMKRVS